MKTLVLIIAITLSSSVFCANEAQDMEKVILQELDLIRSQEQKNYEAQDRKVEEDLRKEETELILVET